MHGVRVIAKRSLERATVLTGVESLARRMRKARVLVLALHNVAPDDLVGQGDRSLHLGLSRFRGYLDFLERHATVLPLGALLEHDLKIPRRRPAVVLTFDDAYRGAIELGVPEITARGLPATICVAPGLLGDQTLWWDALATDGLAGLPDSFRERALEEGRGIASEVLGLAKNAGMAPRVVPGVMRTCTEEELRAACARPRITVASHTWSHAALDRLSRAERRSELMRSREWLMERFRSSYVDVVSFPYGRFDAATVESTLAAEYRAGLTLEPEAMDPEQRPSNGLLPRKNVPAGLSLDGLRIRIALR